jgi:hypothetical protein
MYEEVNEVKGDSPFRSDSEGRDRSEAEILEFRGALAPFLIMFPLGNGHALPYWRKPQTLRKIRRWSDSMQQPHLGDVTIYADIGEVRMETWAADCKKLLAAGWVLLGVYPLIRVGDTAQQKPRGEQEQKPLQDTSSMCGA